MSNATTGWLTTEEAQAQERKTVTLRVANVSNKSARGKDAEDHVRFKIAALYSEANSQEGVNTDVAVEELITKLMVDFQWNKGSTPTFIINAPEPVANFILAASGTIRVATLMGAVYELMPAEYEGTMQMGQKIKTNLKMTAEVHPASKAAFNMSEVEQVAKNAAAEIGCRVTEVRRATTQIGGPLPKFYIDMALLGDPNHAFFQWADAYKIKLPHHNTTDGDFVRFSLNKELVEQNRLCKNCYMHGGCYCVTKKRTTDFGPGKQAKKKKALARMAEHGA